MDAGKVEKKLRRKLLQVSQRFPNCNLTISNVPTPYVFIGNGGMGCGVSNELLSTLLQQGGCTNVSTVYNINPATDFSVVEFTGVAASEMAVLQLNGRCVQKLVDERGLMSIASQVLMKGPPVHLLMAFLSELPPLFRSSSEAAGDKITDSRALPPGCHLLDGFISDEEELCLLQFFAVDFSKVLKSLRRCIQWEKRVRSIVVDEELGEEKKVGGFVDKGSGKVFCMSTKIIICNTSIFTLWVNSYTDAKHTSVCPLDEESKLLDQVDKERSYTHLKLRTVHHYGYEFLYGTNTIDPATPLPGGLPSIIDFLLKRIMNTGLVQYQPDQLTVNEYEPGAGWFCIVIFIMDIQTWALSNIGGMSVLVSVCECSMSLVV